MSTKITSACLCVILGIQLLVLQPGVFTIPHRESGSVTTVTEVPVPQKQVSAPADLATVGGKRDRRDALVFVGDVMLGRHVETLLQRYGSDYPYRGFDLTGLASSTAVIANFESAMTVPHQKTTYYTMRFSVSEDHISALGEQVSYASLANNHSLDFGEIGYYNAVQVLRQHGITPFGHYTKNDEQSIVRIPTTRGDIALIGINATAQIPLESEIDTLCQDAKEDTDFQIFFVHWGDEYHDTHNETQRLLAELFVAACGDLVIGHHPHVVQDIDLINGVPVFYSLGNYIFDQYFSPAVMQGLVVALSLDGVPRLELIPVTTMIEKTQPRALQGLERDAFLRDLADKSHPSLRAAISKGSVPLFEPVATSTKIAIMSR